MRRRTRKGGDEAEVNMTPMLDIVFIMLIFFIVTATFLSEQGIDLTQPPPPPDDDTPTKSRPAITVYVNAKDQCAVDGRGTECDRVALAVERILADKPGANIILRVHEQASHGNLIFLKDGFDSRDLATKVEIVYG